MTLNPNEGHLFASLVADEITGQLKGISAAGGQVGKLASQIECHKLMPFTSTRIFGDIEHGGRSEIPMQWRPDIQFRDTQTHSPCVILEVSVSHESKSMGGGGKNLENLASSYLEQFTRNIKVLIGIEIKYGFIEEARLSMWRTIPESLSKENSPLIRRDIMQQPFRLWDGSSVNPAQSLSLSLSDFAAPTDLSPTQVDISFARLADLLTLAEQRASRNNPQADELPKTVQRPPRKPRRDSQTEMPPNYSFLSNHPTDPNIILRLEKDEENFICFRCQAIDFDLAFNLRIKGIYGSLITKLGVVDECWKKSRCRLCRLFLDLRPESDGPFDLYAFSSRMVDADPRVYMGHGRIPGLEDSVVLAVIKRRDHVLHLVEETVRVLRGTGFISLVKPQHPWRITSWYRLICAESADFSLIKEWLTFCQNNHRQRCAMQHPMPVPGLKLIDCVTKQIVMADEGMEYLALSYVWGPGATSCYRSFPGSLIPSDIPQTISDAVAVAGRLQYRYLWIDRYCISQDNPEEKHAQIPLMGSIYRNAEATIVAAAGVDPTYGLPGLGHRSRSIQQTVTVGKHTLCSTRPDPRQTVERSPWMSRGWTYQEAFLSRRLIFFTEDQVYFECQGMNCKESFSPALCALNTENNRRFRSDLHPGIFRKIKEDISCLKVWEVVSDYTGRSMSFDEDVLRAIWVSRYSRFPKGSLAHAFANALLWFHEQPARRRPQFPSWSWAGWDGPLRFLYKDDRRRFYSQPIYNGCRCTKSIVELSVETNSQSIIDWSTVSEMLPLKGGKGDLTGVLRVQAWTINLRFVSYPQGFTDGGKLPGFYAYFDADRVDTDDSGTLYNCRLYSLLSLSRRLDPAAMEDMQHREFAGIILGCSDKVQGNRVLVVDTSSEIAERVGLLDLAGWGNFVRGTRKADSCDAVAPVPLTVTNNWSNVGKWQLQKTWRTIRLG